jgi:ComF family protein
MIALLRRGGVALLDLLYPPCCPGCGRIGFTFCQACQARIEPLPAPGCLRCGRPLDIEGLCPICRATPSNLDRIASSAVFAAPLREAIHSLKYDNVRILAKPLGLRMASYWQEHGFTAGVIVPVPLHKRRQAERGYNQSALLARVLAQETGIPLDEKLVMRHKATQQQTRLNAAERRENVKDAFSCRGDAAGLAIVLVDDVCTTGSTLEACAGALRAAGAASVWAFTLARARGAPGYADADAG